MSRIVFRDSETKELRNSGTQGMMGTIRAGRDDELAVIERIINAAALAYRGVIPDDMWREPYMPMEELKAAIASGVAFSVYDTPETGISGVMGIQHVEGVDLVRHAYVAPGFQRQGIGEALIRHLMLGTSRQILVGTWADARWAIRFYERNGFVLATETQQKVALSRYWSISARQAEVSVVLAKPSLP